MTDSRIARGIRAFLSVDEGRPSEMSFIVLPKLGDEIQFGQRTGMRRVKVTGLRHGLGPDGTGALIVQARAA